MGDTGCDDLQALRLTDIVQSPPNFLLNLVYFDLLDELERLRRVYVRLALLQVFPAKNEQEFLVELADGELLTSMFKWLHL